MPVPPTRYTLVCSGTYNPPHRGHALTGLHAAARLAARGHCIERLVFLPVHDNYLLNKLAARAATASSEAAAASAEMQPPPSASLGAASDAPHFPMTARCELLALLVETELARLPAAVRLVVGEVSVLPYEQTHAALLLQDSPAYWGRILPGGHLRTVPTARLIRALASDVGVVPPGARLGLVFGSDNLAGMAKWECPAQLLASSDLVLIARGQLGVLAGGTAADELRLEGEGMRSLLSAVQAVDADAGVDVGMPEGFEVDLGDEPRGERTHGPHGGTASAQACGGSLGWQSRGGEEGRAGVPAPPGLRLRRQGGGGGEGGGGGDEGGAGAASGRPHGEGGTVLYALESPCASVLHLSSTAIRAALATLSAHGYMAPPLLLGPQAASVVAPELCCSAAGHEAPSEISEVQPEMPERPSVAEAVRGVARASATMPPLGGLLGGWVGGGPRLWKQVYDAAVERGELAGVHECVAEGK